MNRFLNCAGAGAGAALAALTVAGLVIGAAEADRVRQREQFAVPGWVLTGAALDLDFQNGRYWQAGTPCRSPVTCLSVNRASTHYCGDVQGNWIPVGNNQPCVTNRGFLVEESQTNTIRNSTMTGAVPGTPGTIATDWAIGNAAGLTTSIVAAGTDANGISYMDIRFFGTSTGSFVAIFPDLSSNAIAAAQGQIWTFSFFEALAGGSLTNVNSIEADIQEADGGGSILASDVVTVSLPTSASETTQRASSGSVALGNVRRLLFGRGSGCRSTVVRRWISRCGSAGRSLNGALCRRRAMRRARFQRAARREPELPMFRC